MNPSNFNDALSSHHEYFLSNHYFVNVGVFMVMSVKITFFWNVTACSLVENY